jgi:hypothetical protein
MEWLSLILSLPSDSATLRMRVWRTLKATGAATLRDGVYLLPELGSHKAFFEDIAAEALASGGTAFVVQMTEPTDGQFIALFNRSEEYRQLLHDVDALGNSLTETPAESQKQVRKVRKAFVALSEIDFFPGEHRLQVEAALSTLEKKIIRLLSPDEPLAANGEVPLLKLSDYQKQTWATRQRPWVDRLASAWLIQRFIDPHARIIWLPSPAECPSNAIGFDFDGAQFSHVGALVTFEALLASFQLENAGLSRLASVIHFLDVGGIQPPEAAGIEQVLAGLRDTMSDDDHLLAAASSIFDGLLITYQKSKESTAS